jgi:hypothetical protein
MATITIKDGVLSREYVCACGANCTITMQLPEGVIYNGPITVNAQCPACGNAVVIPDGHHYIENYQLLTK